MRPVLFNLPGPSLLTAVALFALVAIGLGAWLCWLHRRQGFTRDQLYTAATVLVMAGVILAVLQRIGHVRVNAYGAMLMLGFVAGTLTAIRLGRRRGIPGERLLDLGLIILVGAIIGARLGYIVQNPHEAFIDWHAVLASGLGGLSFHGGLIGGTLTGGCYIAFTRLNFWRTADCAAPGVAIGYAITRIGCFLNGCCYGKYAPNLPWRMSFPHAPGGGVYDVHPTQLYASLMGLTMFGILLLLSRRGSLQRSGRLFMIFLMLEGIERFVMEVYRFQPPEVAHQQLTPAQFVSILLFIVGLIGLFLLPKRPAVDPALTSHEHMPSTTPAS